MEDEDLLFDSSKEFSFLSPSFRVIIGHLHTQTHTHTHTHTYIHTQTHTHTHAHTQHTHNTHTHTHTQTHAHTHTHTHTHKHTHIHTHTHTHTHTHAHKHTHIHTHTHTTVSTCVYCHIEDIWSIYILHITSAMQSIRQTKSHAHTHTHARTHNTHTHTHTHTILRNVQNNCQLFSLNFNELITLARCALNELVAYKRGVARAKKWRPELIIAIMAV